MLQAILHGKVSRELENLEDMLTSNVFGLLRYLSPEDGLFKFLSLSEDDNGFNPLEYLRDSDLNLPATIDYSFWPWWDQPNCFGCEPDLVLEISLKNSEPLLILVEAKYLSGKSSEADPTEEKPTDQLAREWSNLESIAKTNGRLPTLIYLTAHSGFPKSEIDAARDELKEKRPDSKPRILWLSWRHLYSICKNSDDPILQDLRALLDRLNLRFFEGFDSTYKPATVGWLFRGTLMTYDWSSQQKDFRSDWRFNE